MEDPVEPCEDCLPFDIDFDAGYELTLWSCDYASAKDSLILADTLVGGTVNFRANVDCYDSLHWKIGFDPTIRSGKEISVYFGNQFTNTTDLPIHLFAYKRNEKCPEIAEVDSITKIVVFEPFDYQNYFGDFLGHHSDEAVTDTFTVSITGSGQVNPSIEIVNIHRGCDLPASFTSLQDYSFIHRRIFFCQSMGPTGSGCGETRAVIKYSHNYDTIVVEYDYAPDVSQHLSESNTSHKTFVGIRK